MRIRAGLFAVLAVFAIMPAAARAQTLGPMLAYHDDAEAFGIGAAFGLPLDQVGAGVGLLADFIWFFPDGDVDYFEVNGNITYDLPLEQSTVVPFVLAGLNIAHSSVSAFSDTNLGLNLGGGVEFDAGTLRPTVGLRIELEGGESFVIFGSLPFDLSGS